MKISLHILALLLALLLILGASQIARLLPTDSGEFVEKKYAGWSGVLRCWVCAGWSPGGSLVGWLNRCAAEFEKDHEGVYLEFTGVSREAMAQLPGSGMRPPELLFFSPGLVSRESVAGDALPVAMGGYIWVCNSDLTDAPPDLPICLPDDTGRCFSAAAICLRDDPAAPEPETVEPGLDLGLPASAGGGALSLEDFIDGRLPAVIVSQSELARLVRLREAGKGPDWFCAPTGTRALGDQLLFGAATAGEAEAPAREFLAFLREEECQKLLGDAGAFSATGVPVHPPHSSYAAMEQLLCSRPLLQVDPFMPYPPVNSDVNVRLFFEGGISIDEALENIFPGSTQIKPLL